MTMEAVPLMFVAGAIGNVAFEMAKGERPRFVVVVMLRGGIALAVGPLIIYLRAFAQVS